MTRRRKPDLRQLDLFERAVAETLSRGLSDLVKREKARLVSQRKPTIRRRAVTVTEHTRWIVDTRRRRRAG